MVPAQACIGDHQEVNQRLVMTVKDLVAKLQEMPQDLPVVLYDNEYNDYEHVKGVKATVIPLLDVTEEAVLVYAVEPL